MPTIEIDFDVFKKITSLRETEQITPNDVLRELLNLPKRNKNIIDVSAGKSWMVKGVSFPHGTEFSAIYKGQEYKAIVDNGALLIKNKRFFSPSLAAVSITGYPVNGWNFWKCKMPGKQNWDLIESYRNQN
jgi:hypothetical protein